MGKSHSHIKHKDRIRKPDSKFAAPRQQGDSPLPTRALVLNKPLSRKQAKRSGPATEVKDIQSVHSGMVFPSRAFWVKIANKKAVRHCKALGLPDYQCAQAACRNCRKRGESTVATTPTACKAGFYAQQPVNEAKMPCHGSEYVPE